MNIELINTGSELLGGRVLNTHQQWIGQQLFAAGYALTRQTTVADSGPSIQQAVHESLARADVIITTGGLGPTSDDLTRDYLAKLLQRDLLEDAGVMTALREFYAARGRPLLDSVKVQAMVPVGARVLPNRMGTAPGLAIEVAPNPFRPSQARSWLILLPGPSRELHPMFLEQVVPLLKAQFPLDHPLFACLLKTTSWGESMIEEAIAPTLQPLVLEGLEIGYCARVGEVEVWLCARRSQGMALVNQAEQIVRQKIGPIIFGGPQDTLEKVVIEKLVQRGESLATAESCTGGYIAHRLTNVPGASAVFLAGLVTYSNEAKQCVLGVPADLIERHGAVSEPTAAAMAEGARKACHAHYALAVTGIAGPTGGSPEKPIGTVFIALATPHHTTVSRFLNRFDRESFKQATAQQALNLLRIELLTGP